MARPRRLLAQRGLLGRQARARSTGSSGRAELPFSGYLEDRSALVDKTSDHPMIVSDATLDASIFPNALSSTPPPVLDPNATY